MSRSKTFATLAGIAIAFFASQAPAQSGAADNSFTFPAGMACNFEMGVEIWGSAHRVSRTFTLGNGRVIEFNGGKGVTLRFTNATSGNSLTLKPTGSIDRTETLPDGSVQITTTGQYVWIFFPTDIPAGPSTIQYTGRVVVKNTGDPINVVSTLIRSSGRTLDICAAIQ